MTEIEDKEPEDKNVLTVAHGSGVSSEKANKIADAFKAFLGDAMKVEVKKLPDAETTPAKKGD